MKNKKPLVVVAGLILLGALVLFWWVNHYPEITRAEFDLLATETQGNSAWVWYYHGTNSPHHHFTIMKGPLPQRFKIKVQDLKLSPGVEFALGSNEERPFKFHQIAP